MATEARKRPGDAGDNGKRTRMRVDGGGSSATEDEVEEFFAILRQIHARGRCLGNGSGSAVKATDKVGGWTPALAWEDFERTNGVRSEGDGGAARRKGEGEERKTEEGEERTEENAVLLSLDLNADPEPEPDAHFSR